MRAPKASRLCPSFRTAQGLGLAPVSVAAGQATSLLKRGCYTQDHYSGAPAMDPCQPNTGLLPPALRALALGLLVETVMPLLNPSRTEDPGPPGPDEGDTEGKAELWQALRGKCGELSALVLRAGDPGEAAAYVLDYLPKHFEYVFELIYGQKRRPVPDHREAVAPVATRNGKHSEVSK